MHKITSPAPVLPIKSISNVRIGQILHDTGKLAAADIQQVLLEQRKRKIRFGEAARLLRLATESDIEQALSRQFGYPCLPPEQSDLSPELVAAYAPHGKQAIALRALRSQLMLHWFGKGRKALAIVSAGREEGSSLLAANLAIVCSQLGKKTLLVDTNLREPCQHGLFKLQGYHGLADILADRTDLGAIANITAFPDLSVLQAGTRAPNPQELLGSGSYSELVCILESQFEIVLYDLPAFSMGADALTIAARGGGTLLVARKNATSLPALSAAVRELSQAGVEVAGSVMMNF